MNEAFGPRALGAVDKARAKMDRGIEKAVEIGDKRTPFLPTMFFGAFLAWNAHAAKDMLEKVQGPETQEKGNANIESTYVSPTYDERNRENLNRFIGILKAENVTAAIVSDEVDAYVQKAMTVFSGTERKFQDIDVLADLAASLAYISSAKDVNASAVGFATVELGKRLRTKAFGTDSGSYDAGYTSGSFDSGAGDAPSGYDSSSEDSAPASSQSPTETDAQ